MALDRSGLPRTASRRDPLIAGGDVTTAPDERELLAGWVLWSPFENRIVEAVHVVRPLTFPYVPGLLSFRETPPLLAAARKLRREPDAFLVDGHGRSHPRRFGLACHIGLLLNRPTVGCAKSRLVGDFETPGASRGACTMLRHAGEVIGVVLRTREGVSPVFVSVGHCCDLTSATRIVLACCRGLRLPEPTRLAHQYVTVEAVRRWR